ncbi:hypothetical protein BKA59DRAFT_549900 [Fusarium tricinctum]|uniref:Protein kinase domain-containing protein n=1 Tax=Fusarium tricinctum TaxID=61284 RepID=A0A8K0RL38_9HYPO|nr:hypothetical protein BKA59DRAFT_549900 [Fusarium tricinctum]
MPPQPPLTLGTLIRQTTVKSSFDSRTPKFLPEGKLGEIVTRDFILRALYKTPDRAPRNLPDPVNKVISFISIHAMKIFSIAILIGLKGARLYCLIVFLMKKRIYDSKLPLKEKELNEFSPTMQPEQDTESMRPDNEDILWDDDNTHDFIHHQWSFCAPIFSTHRENHDIDEEAILPFIEKDLASADEGAFGQVMKYKIHESHLDASGLIIPCTEHVAIKKIKIDSTQDQHIKISGWEKEVVALWKIRALGEKHIVNFITAFRLGQDEHYLILEWADGGNLKKFWETFREPLTPDLVKDACGQLLGLARALHKVHSPKDKSSDEHFRHGDLKPENILWFKDKTNSSKIGTLKIGDWGLAKQHHDITQLRTVQTSTGFGTRRYEPPEERTVRDNNLIVPNDTGKIVRKRSRLYDLWAMGCIWLEFLIWLMYGLDGLKRFNRSFHQGQSDNPSYYELDRNNGAKVHHVALRWIEHMTQDPVCEVGQTALGDLLEFIRDRLLVVKLPQNLGSNTDMSNTPRARRRSSSGNDTIIGDLPPRGITTSMDIPKITLNEPDPTENLAKENSPFSITMSPPVSPVAPQSDKGCRALAKDLYDRMEDIVTDVDTPQYWLSGNPLPPPDHAVEVSGSRYEPQSQPSTSFQATLSVVQSPGPGSIEKLEDNWHLTIDNEFADRAISSVKGKDLDIPSIQESSKLCVKCLTFRDGLWKPGFSISYDSAVLKANSSASICDLCGLLWAFCQKRDSTLTARVHFERSGSTIVMNSYTPVGSVFRSQGLSTGIDNQIQLGFPILPDAGTPTHFEIVGQWLKHCDTQHQGCTREPSRTNSNSLGANKRLPTRVIAVNHVGHDSVHLVETTSIQKGSWVALSHQWGTGRQFRTVTTNLQEHIAGIKIDHLPHTFRDAVKVTRAIGCPYLWIDSICIVQGPDGDFQQEAKQMEQVYSGAYCVLAASRHPGHDAGFLGPRTESRSISLRSTRTSEPFFIREIIDDFQTHVSDGPLGGRGWVLQEHALARRTVYYTDFQCYFECGDGVRCETLTKMTNQRAAFLGDPNFPRLMIKADKGAKILGYQDLYKSYSGLGLSIATDRPWAINSLQQRIITALKVQGGFGVFYEDSESGRRRGLLRRSLLWHRANKSDSLSRIQFSPNRDGTRVPTWSWMAYTGTIDYIPAEFGGTEWEVIHTQWDSGPNRTDEGVLVAQARDYIAGSKDSLLVFDSILGSGQGLSKCVILGRQKGNQPDREKVHYVLLVQPRPLSNQGHIYERVGVGTLPGSDIKQNGQQVYIW